MRKSRPQARKTWFPFLVLIGITLICMVPFMGKAFNIDDPLFIWSARHIQSHFADPYGFSVNWYGRVQPMWHVTKNPPLACYYIALWAFAIGWSEWALHLALLIPAIAAVLGIYFLAREFCSRPLEAALAAILTPVFLISGTTVMCDMMMLAFWVWAFFLWVRGMEKNRHGLLAIAMALVTLSALAKYFGAALIPLVVVYSIVKTRRPGIWMLHLLMPVAVLAGYQFATKSLYGHGLLSDAVQYGEYYRSATSAQTMVKVIDGLTFTGGCILTALFYAPLLWKRKGLAAWLILTGLAFLLFLLRPLPPFKADGAAALQSALFAIGGLILLALAVQDYISRRDAVSLVLLLWVTGTFVFAGVMNWSVSARSILPVAPAAGILIMRRIELLHPKKDLSRYLYAPLALAAFASILVSYADYQTAAFGRSAAEQIAATYGSDSRSIWFEGHWGFQYYMESQGGKPIVFKSFNPKTGDILIIPTNNTNVEIRDPGIPPIDVLAFHMPVKLATMSQPDGAGFYSDTWGPLPFVVGTVGRELYGIFEVP